MFQAIILEIMKQDSQVQLITIHFHVSRYYTRFCCIRHSAMMNSTYFRILTLSTDTKHVCGYITPNYNPMTHRVSIYQVTVAIYRNLTSITVTDIKSECISHHVSRNNIRNNETRLLGTMIYEAFPRKTLLRTVLLHLIHCKDEFRVFHDLNFDHTC